MIAPGGREERRSLAEAAIRRVGAGICDVLGDRYVVVPGEKRPNVYDSGLVVRRHDLIERCPRRAAQPPDGDFAWSTRTARRQIGLAALRLLQDDSSPVDNLVAAVHEALSDRSALGQNLAGWLDGQGRAGLAALTAAASGWAAGVQRMVPPDPRVRWADPTAAENWDHPERLVRVSAARDASIGGAASGEVLLLVADSDADHADRLRAAHLALVRSLLSRRAPARITLAAPSRGVKTRIEVDRPLLDLAADRLVEHIGLLADPERAATRPGRWCAHCHLYDVCEARYEE